MLDLIVGCEGNSIADTAELIASVVCDILEAEATNLQLGKKTNINSMTNMSMYWQKRKLCIDIIYSLAVLAKNDIIPLKDRCVFLVGRFKLDRIKEVRESANNALQSLGVAERNISNNSSVL